VISTKEGKKKADSFGLPFFEVSALSKHNIEICFEEMLKRVYIMSLTE